MNNSDYAEFAASWSAMVEMLAGRETSDGVIDMAFGLLSGFTVLEITTAMTKHCMTNKWAPAPCEIIEQIVGKRPTVESMAGMARNPATPLGVFISMTVGSYDIGVMDDDRLIRRVKSHAEEIDSFIDRAQVGDFTDHEIRVYAGRGIDPSGDLCRGLRGPSPDVKAIVSRRYQSAIVPAIEADTEDAPRTDEDKARAAKAMAEMKAILNGGTIEAKKPATDREREAAREKALRDIEAMKAVSTEHAA